MFRPSGRIEGSIQPTGVLAPSPPPAAATAAAIRVQPPPSARFLQRDEAGWMVVSDDIARNRVSRAFRNRRLASGARAAATTSPSPKSASSSPFGHRPPEGGAHVGVPPSFGGQVRRASPPSLPFPYPPYRAEAIETAMGLTSTAMDPSSLLQPSASAPGSFGRPMDDDDDLDDPFDQSGSSNKRRKFDQV